MPSQLLAVCFNVLLYVVLFCVYIGKRKRFDIGAVLIVQYISCAIFGIPYYLQNIESYKTVTLGAYLLLFGLHLLVFAPVLRFNNRNLKEIDFLAPVFINTIAVIFIVLYLPIVLRSVPEAVADFQKFLFDSSIYSELYSDNLSTVLSSSGRNFTNLLVIFTGMFSDIMVFFAFYYLTYPKRNTIIALLLLMCSTYPVLASILDGSRTGMTWWLFELIILFFIFSPLFSKRIKRLLRPLLVGLMLVVVTIFVLITFSRFAVGSDRDAVNESFVHYVGQSMVNFGSDALNNNTYLYGDNTAPLFRRLVGLESSDNVLQRQMKWANKINVRTGAFYTAVGDLYYDYGPLLLVLILAVCSLMFAKLLKYKEGSIALPKMLLLFFWCCICFDGVFYFPYKTIGGNLRIIALVLFVILLNVLYSIQKQKGVKYVS